MKVTVNGAEETSALTYHYKRGMNKNIDQAVVIISDVDGISTQKYLPNLYLFKPISIEDPTGTKVFDGRINNIITKGTFVSLTCEGWLAQLDDLHLESYNTKEILLTPAYRNGVIGAVSSYQITSITVNTQNPNWATDTWVGYAVVFPDNLTSVPRIVAIYCTSASFNPESAWYPWWTTPKWDNHQTVHTSDSEPWNETKCIAISPSGNITYGSGCWFMLEFQSPVAKSTLVTNGIDVVAHIMWNYHAYYSTYPMKWQIYNYTASTWDNLDQWSAEFGDYSPSHTSQSNNYMSDDGHIKVRLYTDEEDGLQLHPNDCMWYLEYCKITLHYNAAVASSAFPITANGTNTITSSLSFQDAGVQANDPFNICKKSSEHVKALVQAYDVQKAFTVSNVTATNKYPPREWKEASPLTIIGDLALEDDVDFWVNLSQEFFYNRPAPSPTKYIDANDVFKDFGMTTYGTQMRNEMHVWGYKYPSPSTMEVHQVRTSESSKTTFGITRSQVERDTAIYTALDANARGDGLLSKSAFPKRQFSITLAGKKNNDDVWIDVGDTIGLTLSKYALNEGLIIVAKAYDPVADETTYDVAYYGSAARFMDTDLLHQLDAIGKAVTRLTIQSAQR